MLKVARLVPLLDKSMDLMNKMEGYWEESDGEFDEYVKQVKTNLKSMQKVCNDLINFLLHAIETECEELFDDD